MRRPAMNDEQLLRYSRHILLDELGIEGQQRLLAAARAGDRRRRPRLARGAVPRHRRRRHASRWSTTTRVDLTNLQRQIAHDLARVGQPKAESAAQTHRAINPDVQVVALQRACRRGAARRAGRRGRRGGRLQRQLRHPPRGQRRLRRASASRWSRARRSASTARSRSTTRAMPTPALLRLPVPARRRVRGSALRHHGRVRAAGRHHRHACRRPRR